MQSIADKELTQGVDFELIESLPADGTNCLLIFDDSLEILSKSEKFNAIATAGRHRYLNCVYIKHILFHKNKTGRDAKLRTTHTVLLKYPRDVQQIDILGRQLDLGKQLKQWFDDATQEPYGHLMIDLRPSTSDLLRYCSKVTSFPSELFVPNIRARISDINVERSELLYSQVLSESQQKFSTAFLLHCPKEFIRFLCECIVNLIEWNLTRVKEISLLASKNKLESSHQNYNPNFQKTCFRLKSWNTILICIYQPCLNNFTTFFNYEVKKFLLVPKKLSRKRKLSQPYSEIEKKNKRFSQLSKKRKKKLCPKKNDRPPKEPKTDLEFVFFLS